MSACFCRGGPTCCKIVLKQLPVAFEYPPLKWSHGGVPSVDPADIFRSRVGQEEFAKAWNFGRRQANHRVFAADWKDPVEASHYAGYMGA